MKFNLKRFLELIAESYRLLEQGKTLLGCDENKYDELDQYRTLLEDDVFWKSRYEYLQILLDFLSRKINWEELIDKLNGLDSLNRDDADIWQEKLATLAFNDKFNDKIDLPNVESGGFLLIIESIFRTIELFDPNLTLEINLNEPNEEGICEEFLRLDIEEKHIPEIFQYCPEFYEEF